MLLGDPTQGSVTGTYYSLFQNINLYKPTSTLNLFNQNIELLSTIMSVTREKECYKNGHRWSPASKVPFIIDIINDKVNNSNIYLSLPPYLSVFCLRLSSICKCLSVCLRNCLFVRPPTGPSVRPSVYLSILT